MTRIKANYTNERCFTKPFLLRGDVPAFLANELRLRHDSGQFAPPLLDLLFLPLAELLVFLLRHCLPRTLNSL